MSTRNARASFAALAVISLLAGLAAAPFILAQPNPSGSSVSAAALDAGRVRTEIHDGTSYPGLAYVVATSNASATPGGNALRGLAYDLTFTNLSTSSSSGYGYSYSPSLTGLRLCGPDDFSRGNARDLYADGAHAGRHNVTFPSMALDASGVWGLYAGVTSAGSPCEGSGTVVARFFVREPSGGSPGTPTARIVAPDLSGGALLPVAGPIRLQNVTAVGSLVLNLTFNPAVVEIVGVSKGTVPNGSLTWNVDNGTGALRLLVTNPARPGPSGSFIVANVSFKAKGAPGSTSALHLDAIELTNSDGAAIPFLAVDGRFRVGILGDVTGNGVVDAADLTTLSRYVVGAIPASGLALANGDTNADGQVTSVDALFLSQHLAGTRPALG